MDFDKAKEAVNITENILASCIDKIRKFRTEKDVYSFLKNEVRKNKCKFSFIPIVASGKNGYEMHHRPTNDNLVDGFLVLDFGVRYKDFCTDLTRTIYLGNPNQEEVYFYNLVLLAQKESFKQVIPGIKGFELDGIARSILGNYRKSFIHSLGHGVGYRIHQKPWISPFKKNAVRKNDIITLEPGLYFKNKFGIRIEDMVIARKRPVYLTKINRNLVIK